MKRWVSGVGGDMGEPTLGATATARRPWQPFPFPCAPMGLTMTRLAPASMKRAMSSSDPLPGHGGRTWSEGRTQHVRGRGGGHNCRHRCGYRQRHNHNRRRRRGYGHGCGHRHGRGALAVRVLCDVCVHVPVTPKMGQLIPAARMALVAPGPSRLGIPVFLFKRGA